MIISNITLKLETSIVILITYKVKYVPTDCSQIKKSSVQTQAEMVHTFFKLMLKSENTEISRKKVN
jgi:hypothetical protein